MVDTISSGGGSGARHDISALNMEDLRAIVQADLAKKDDLQQVAEGYSELEALLEEAVAEIRDRSSDVAANFSSPAAGERMAQELENIADAIESEIEPVRRNKSHVDEAVTHVETVAPVVEQYASDYGTLQTRYQEDPHAFKVLADSGSAADGFGVAREQVLSDAREAFRSADSGYLITDAFMNQPERPDWPQWEGGEPRQPIDQYTQIDDRERAQGGGVPDRPGGLPAPGADGPGSTRGPGAEPTVSGASGTTTLVVSSGAPELQGSTPGATAPAPATGGTGAAPSGTVPGGVGGTPSGTAGPPPTPPVAGTPGGNARRTPAGSPPVKSNPAGPTNTARPTGSPASTARPAGSPASNVRPTGSPASNPRPAGSPGSNARPAATPTARNSGTPGTTYRSASAGNAPAANATTPRNASPNAAAPRPPAGNGAAPATPKSGGGTAPGSTAPRGGAKPAAAPGVSGRPAGTTGTSGSPSVRTAPTAGAAAPGASGRNAASTGVTARSAGAPGAATARPGGAANTVSGSKPAVTGNPHFSGPGGTTSRSVAPPGPGATGQGKGASASRPAGGVPERPTRRTARPGSLTDTVKNTSNSRTQQANGWRRKPKQVDTSVHAGGLVMAKHSRQAKLEAAAQADSDAKAEAAMIERRRAMIEDIVAGRRPQLDHVNDPEHFAFGLQKDGVVPGVIRGARRS